MTTRAGQRFGGIRPGKPTTAGKAMDPRGKVIAEALDRIRQQSTPSANLRDMMVIGTEVHALIGERDEAQADRDKWRAWAGEHERAMLRAQLQRDEARAVALRLADELEVRSRYYLGDRPDSAAVELDNARIFVRDVGPPPNLEWPKDKERSGVPCPGGKT